MSTFSGYARQAMLRKREYERLSPEQKLAKARRTYMYRAERSIKREPAKIHVRVVSYGQYGCSQLYVLVMRRSYIAARTIDGLLQKIVLGGWRPVEGCKGPAKRAFR